MSPRDGGICGGGPRAPSLGARPRSRLYPSLYCVRESLIFSMAQITLFKNILHIYILSSGVLLQYFIYEWILLQHWVCFLVKCNVLYRRQPAVLVICMGTRAGRRSSATSPDRFTTLPRRLGLHQRFIDQNFIRHAITRNILAECVLVLRWMSLKVWWMADWNTCIRQRRRARRESIRAVPQAAARVLQHDYFVLVSLAFSIFIEIHSSYWGVVGAAVAPAEAGRRVPQYV